MTLNDAADRWLYPGVIGLIHPTLLRISLVDQHPVSKSKRVSLLLMEAGLSATFESGLGEGVGADQTVVARMPIARVLRVARVVHHPDAKYLALDDATVIQPRRPLTPTLLFGDAADAILDAAALIPVH